MHTKCSKDTQNSGSLVTAEQEKDRRRRAEEEKTAAELQSCPWTRSPGHLEGLGIQKPLSVEGLQELDTSEGGFKTQFAGWLKKTEAGTHLHWV